MVILTSIFVSPAAITAEPSSRYNLDFSSPEISEEPHNQSFAIPVSRVSDRQVSVNSSSPIEIGHKNFPTNTTVSIENAREDIFRFHSNASTVINNSRGDIIPTYNPMANLLSFSLSDGIYSKNFTVYPNIGLEGNETLDISVFDLDFTIPEGEEGYIKMVLDFSEVNLNLFFFTTPSIGGTRLNSTDLDGQIAINILVDDRFSINLEDLADLYNNTSVDRLTNLSKIMIESYVFNPDIDYSLNLSLDAFHLFRHYSSITLSPESDIQTLPFNTTLPPNQSLSFGLQEGFYVEIDINQVYDYNETVNGTYYFHDQLLFFNSTSYFPTVTDRYYLQYHFQDVSDIIWLNSTSYLGNIIFDSTNSSQLWYITIKLQKTVSLPYSIDSSILQGRHLSISTNQTSINRGYLFHEMNSEVVSSNVTDSNLYFNVPPLWSRGEIHIVVFLDNSAYFSITKELTLSPLKLVSSHKLNIHPAELEIIPIRVINATSGIEITPKRIYSYEGNQLRAIDIGGRLIIDPAEFKTDGTLLINITESGFVPLITTLHYKILELNPQTILSSYRMNQTHAAISVEISSLTNWKVPVFINISDGISVQSHRLISPLTTFVVTNDEWEVESSPLFNITIFLENNLGSFNYLVKIEPFNSVNQNSQIDTRLVLALTSSLVVLTYLGYKYYYPGIEEDIISF